MSRRRGLLDRRTALVAGAAALLVGLLLQLMGVFGRVESATVDMRFSVRGDRAPDRRIVVVRIDADTFGALGRRWPFPRSLHARVIDRLRAAGARAIAYDIQFSEPTTDREDNSLIAAVRRAGTVVLAATEVDDNGTANVFGSGAAQRAARAHVGFSGFPVEAGGVIRKVPSSVDGLSSFARTAAAVFRGVPVDGLAFSDDAWIDYAGPGGTYPAIDYAEVLRGSFDPDKVRGRIVVVGAYAPSLQDVHPTAVAPHDLMAGAEVQANAIATVLRGRPLRPAHWIVSILAILLLGAVVPLAAIRLRLAVVPLAVGLGLGYLAALQLAFDHGKVLPFVGPVSALLVSVAAVLVTSVQVTSVEHRRTRDQLGRFLPADLVDTMLAGASDDGHLAGKEAVATALAVDLRGFTRFSESASPATIVDVLNAYFATMGDAVEANGGIVVSYAGDGIIAVFGAPVAVEDHADRALDTARQMAGWRLAAFNEWLRAQGLSTRFAMGIGVASGPLVTGTIGSRRRVEFTAIGDPVNVASRVEQLTKDWEQSVLVAGATVAMLNRPRDDLRRLSETTVRGRDEPLDLWALSTET